MESKAREGASPTDGATGVAINHAGRRVLLKWHRLRRSAQDPLFSAHVLAEGLRLGASMEIDLRVTRDGGFAVLHDERLDEETSGAGLVAERTGEEIRELHYAEPARDGAPRAVMLAEDIAELLGPAHPDALLQLDMKDDLSEGRRGVDRLAELFAGHQKHLVVSGDDTDLTRAIGEKLPGMKQGLEPSFRLLDLYRAGEKDKLASQLSGELGGPVRPYIVYLWWQLVLDADADGIDLIRVCHDRGALVDAWTFNLADPGAGFSDEEWRKFSRLLELGADQISTDEAIATERAYYMRASAG
ncbi:glycerophosphodiester phosphodiesterase family protein [Chelativorans sp.]|uniref:glycerophosphodiester phosphodiesterase n=1 Tax=Chelativorans sp. TaxID=2203393 RepID=UPI002810B94B|nr:glycerophosphodiester phosphodiesterase family protein [Chelativorans sp.]